MQRISAFWNRGLLGKAVISGVVLLLGCCVLGILVPRRPAQPAATVSIPQATAAPAATSAPVPTEQPTAKPEPTDQPATPVPTAKPALVIRGTAPQGSDCPADHPIKGNIPDRGVNKGDHIYHVPGDNGYAQTKPERCFVDVAEAQAANYRAVK